MRFSSVAFTAILLVSQSGLATMPSATPRIATSQELVIIKHAFDDKLKDPFSMRLRNVRIANVSVCGEVNAKNSYGAYMGYTVFYGVYLDGGGAGKSGAMILHIDSGEDDNVAAQMCAKEGM